MSKKPVKPILKKQHRRTFLREWRETKGLTLEQAAARVGEATGRGFTHATLSRIERGLLPYSQPILEALAEAYGTDPASLLMRDPRDPEGMWTVWEQAKPGERRIIVDLAKTLLKTGS